MLNAIKDLKTMVIDNQFAWIKKHKVFYAMCMIIPAAMIGLYYIVESIQIKRRTKDFEKALEDLDRMVKGKRAC